MESGSQYATPKFVLSLPQDLPEPPSPNWSILCSYLAYCLLNDLWESLTMGTRSAGIAVIEWSEHVMISSPNALDFGPICGGR